MGIITNLLTVVQLLDRLLQYGSMAVGAQHVPAKLNPSPRVRVQKNGYDCGPFVCSSSCHRESGTHTLPEVKGSRQEHLQERLVTRRLSAKRPVSASIANAPASLSG